MGRVTKNQRVLLVVNCLVLPEEEKKSYKLLYGYLEGAGPRVAKRWLDNHYRSIDVLQGSAATQANFLSRLESITHDSSVRALDLFLQLHGSSGRLRFHDDWVNANSLEAEIRKKAKAGRLRLVYNTSCYGDSHSEAFLEAGFMTSVGSLRINANAGVEYPAFCRIWRTGVSIEQVMRRADRPTVSSVQDNLASKVMGFSSEEVNSEKIVRGEKDITIDTEPYIRESQITFTDKIRVHERLKPSRQTTVFNNRRMEKGCTVRAVNLVRVNSRSEIIDGPKRKIYVGNFKRAGVYIDQDGEGTNSLRVRIVSWNGTASHLRYQIIYSVSKTEGANCGL